MTADIWQTLIDDLHAEREANLRVIEALSDDAWDRPSPAEGWSLRDCVVHLAETDDTATKSVLTRDRPPVPTGRAGRRPSGVHTNAMIAWRSRPAAELVVWYRGANDALVHALREISGDERLPWAGRPLGARSFTTARIMEHWSHGLDIHDAAGVPAIDTDRLRHIAFLGHQTREFAYRNRGLEPPVTPLYVELTAPSGEVWTYGPPDAPDRITGPAGDFCRIVTQRIHPSDTALVTEGPHAAEFLSVAQAFAGPPGTGRPPKRETSQA